MSRYTITTALPYANGPVHIGHLAGVYIPADVFVRFLRLKKEDVLFVGGSDEHGVAITLRARKDGVSPQEIVEKYHTLIKDSFEKLGISFDIYSRTSKPIHHETSSAMFKKMYEEGLFTEKETEQYYDEEAKQFLADRYIKGTCPSCGYEEAYGDQCEKCGTSLSPSELGNPHSMLSGSKPVMKKTKHWFFPLDQYEDWLKKWILEEHKEWKPNVYGQCKSWLDNGLQPRAMTRDLDWGVQVPVEGATGKVLYVWFDAPIGYISATKDWAQQNNKDWEPYWKDENTKLIHFIGKDNIVFHCIIFPTVLKAHGDFILPDNVPANEFLNLESNKISTSRNWAVWLHEYLEEFPGKEDVLRYVLTANAPETKDNDFTWKDFQAKNNNELVAILGNFVNRALVLTHKYYEGSIPEPQETYDPDKEVIEKLKNAPEKIEKALFNYKFREALSSMMELARTGNKYLADTEPWHLIKENPERVKTIMYYANQVVASLSILSEPFIPTASEKLQKMINLPDKEWSLAAGTSILPAGHTINKAEILFQKIDDTEIQKQLDKLEATKKENEAEAKKHEAKPTINFEDFTKLDIRTATVLEASKVKKADKLLELKVDTGVDTRTVVSGIAKHYRAEEMIGKQVSVVMNLAPRKIKGIVSQGMILMAEDKDGTLKLVSPEQTVSPGSEIS